MWIVRKEISLQGWLRHYWIGVTAVLVVICLTAQSYILTTLTRRTEETIQKTVRIVQEDIESSLDGVDSFLYESLYSGNQQTAPRLFRSLRLETDPIALGEVRSSVLTSLRSVISWSDMVDFIIVCTEREDGLQWLEVGQNSDYPIRRQVKAYFNEKIGRGELADLQRYMVYSGSSGNYMLRTMRIDSSYLIVCVSQARLLRMLQYAEYAGPGIVFVAELDGTVVSASDSVIESLSPENEGTYITLNGRRYLQTGYVSGRSGYYFGILTPRQNIVGEMRVFYVVFFLIFVGMLILVPLLFAAMNRYVGKPVNAIAGTMEQVAEGDLDLAVSVNSHIQELGQLARSFNHMISRIKQLTIEKYEGQLAVQKATMQYLQLQIKPHFYANMFNIICSLAQRRDYDAIQKVSIAVVSYSRYMFRDAEEMVELWRELEHVDNYLEIQRIRYPDRIRCTIDVPEELREALVPPFIIEGFVENSVKYAASPETGFEVFVRARTDEKKDVLFLEIRDTGRGYSEEILRADWKDENDEGHIGLSNIYHRLKIVYDKKADMQIRNDGGAVTTIQIPYIAADGIDMDDDVE